MENKFRFFTGRMSFYHLMSIHRRKNR